MAFELHYGAGGHGGPYFTLKAAELKARLLLRGNPSERHIDIVDRSTNALVRRIYRTTLSVPTDLDVFRAFYRRIGITLVVREMDNGDKKVILAPLGYDAVPKEWVTFSDLFGEMECYSGYTVITFDPEGALKYQHFYSWPLPKPPHLGE